MLTKKKQRKYLDKQNGEWQENLRRFADSQDPETLHQLRLALKKIKALTRFTKAKKKFLGWSKMFKQAGVIRDADKIDQKETKEAGTKAFLQLVKQYRRQGKRAGRRLYSTIQSIPDQSIRDWYATQIVSTGILLTATGDELHKARKQIKEMLYMEKILPDPLRTELRLDTGYLDELQDAIGNWHDEIIAGADPVEKETIVRQLANNFYLRINR